MSSDNCQFVPPPELRNQWLMEACGQDYYTHSEYIAIKAARWGADYELEACCEWFQEFYKTESWSKHDLKLFRAARRPKPRTQAEEALILLDDISDTLSAVHENGIRRALEHLRELEKVNG